MVAWTLLACLALQAPPARLSSLEIESGWTLDERGERRRDPAHLPGHDVALFDGSTLAGWHAIGAAGFRAEERSILAQTTSGKANSFLVSDGEYGDFLLTLELRNEGPGNSGIQIRSRVVGAQPESAYASGYQIEIDPSARAWSGGLYEERGRGWLQSLEHDEAARKAFRPGEWNRYRIECVGPWIRAWVNDVPTADALDPQALSGILALQVHAGQDTKVRFRELRLHVFGEHAWVELDPRGLCDGGAKLGVDFGLRLRRAEKAPPLAGMRLCIRGQSPGSAPALAFALAGSEAESGWRELAVLAYGDRVALFRDGKRIEDARSPSLGDRAWVWIERAAGAAAPSFEHIETLECVSR